jgi:hypothetical protein
LGLVVLQVLTRQDSLGTVVKQVLVRTLWSVVGAVAVTLEAQRTLETEPGVGAVVVGARMFPMSTVLLGRLVPVLGLI